MNDITSAVVQALPITLSVGILLVLARAQLAKKQRLEKQRVPVRVDRDARHDNLQKPKE
jgi:hypothetical protein